MYQMHLLCKSTTKSGKLSNTAPPHRRVAICKREAGRISTRIKQLDVDCETKSKDHGMSFPTFHIYPPRSL